MKIVFKCKPCLVIFTSFLYVFSSFSQGLTIGEIYDYKAGDEFILKTFISGPPTYNYTKVKSRKDFGNDSVTYGFESINYRLNTSTYIWESKTSTFFYTYKDLGKPYFEMFGQQDTVMYDSFFNPPRRKAEFKDSKYSDSCSDWNRRYSFSQDPLGETVIYEWKAARGIGVLRYNYLRDSNTPTEHRDELLYYKNASGSCGSTKGLPSSVKHISTYGTLSIWPNPASDILNIDVSGTYHCLIMDALGREMMSSSTNEGPVDISDLLPGIYSVIIISNTGSFATKLIKD